MWNLLLFTSFPWVWLFPRILGTNSSYKLRIRWSISFFSIMSILSPKYLLYYYSLLSLYLSVILALCPPLLVKSCGNSTKFSAYIPIWNHTSHLVHFCTATTSFHDSSLEATTTQHYRKNSNPIPIHHCQSIPLNLPQSVWHLLSRPRTIHHFHPLLEPSNTKFQPHPCSQA